MLAGETVMPTRDLIASWLFKEQWNFTERPTFEEFEAYSKACLAGASADGQLAEAERDWVVATPPRLVCRTSTFPAFKPPNRRRSTRS